MKKDNKKKIDLLFIVAVFFSLLFLFFLYIFWAKGGNQRLTIPILLIKLAGFASSFFLILGELGHPVFERFCPREGKFNCFAVMESPAAKIFGIIPMADIGAIYFIGGITLLGLSMSSMNFFYQVYLLGILNLLALPYTIFSVIYQSFVLKAWCKFCLIVQFIFWLEFFYFYKFLSAGSLKNILKFSLPFISVFFILTLIWILVRPLIKKRIREISKS